MLNHSEPIDGTIFQDLAEVCRAISLLYSPGTIRAVDEDLGRENLDDRHGPHRGI